MPHFHLDKVPFKSGQIDIIHSYMHEMNPFEPEWNTNFMKRDKVLQEEYELHESNIALILKRCF